MESFESLGSKFSAFNFLKVQVEYDIYRFCKISKTKYVTTKQEDTYLYLMFCKRIICSWL